MTANQTIGGNPVRSADFFQWNMYIDEVTFDAAWKSAMAAKGVKNGMLVGELIRTRGLKLDRERVEGRLADMAGSYPDPAAILKAYRQNADAMRQVENMVLEEQVVDFLLEHARVTDQAATFKEVMNFGA